MGSRGKQKQMARMAGTGAGPVAAYVSGMSKAEINRMGRETANKEAARVTPGEAFGNGTAPMPPVMGRMQERNEHFRASVDARRAVLAAIQRRPELQKRIEEVYEEGRLYGFKQASWAIIKCCLAGAVLTLKNEFGIEDDEKIIAGLKDLHNRIVWALNFNELADDVLKQTGIEVRTNDPLEPIRRI